MKKYIIALLLLTIASAPLIAAPMDGGAKEKKMLADPKKPKHEKADKKDKSKEKEKNKHEK